MKRLSISIIMLILTVAFLLFAQDAAEQTDGEEGNNFVTESMTNFLIDNFEFANTWQGAMPRDYGLVSIIRREGGPSDVVAEGEEENKYIDALLFYCEVMFLDINVLSKNIPANNKRQELCMPVGIINKISKLRKITEISEYEFLSLINERFENIYNSNCVLTKEQTIDLINCRTR